MAIHESAEMYLETIYLLSQHLSQVRAIDVAEHMGYSKPSVSRAMGLLKQNGYVVTDDTGALVLTESGHAVALKIFERHKVLSQMLIALGVSPENAADDACRIEHVISDESFEAIKRHMEENQ